MIFSEYFINISIVLVITLFIIFYSLYKFRQLLPKPQICWFCHKSQNVLLSQRNSFNCIYCQQYNGFSQDGNYNKSISAQFEPNKNSDQYCRQVPDCYAQSSQLCDECNVGQAVKIKLLAEFIPFNETNFTQECDEYKRHLEKEYKLCSNCELNVRNVLSEPINSGNGLDRNLIQSNINPNIDSVFVRQKSERNRNWFLFLANTGFEALTLFCAIILFVFSLNEFQNKTELSLIELSESLIRFLEFYISKTIFVIGVGVMSSVIGLLSGGKQSLQTKTSNLFCLFLWFAMISTETTLIMAFIDQIDSILLRPILCSFLIIFSTINTLFALFNTNGTNAKNKQNLSKTKVQKNSFKCSTNSKLNVNSKARLGIENSFTETTINANRSANPNQSNQSIGEQIKSLCIVDQSDSKLTSTQTQHYLRNKDININKSLLNCDNTFGKNIILPAKFNYESIAQTSWVSPYQPNPSPRKDRLSSSLYFPNSQQLANTSHWVSHHMSGLGQGLGLGLVTPPPSITSITSVNSESAFVNRYPLTKSTTAQMFDFQRNSFYNSNHSLRSGVISHQYYRHDSIGRSSEEASSCVTQVNGSLSSLTINKTSNKCRKATQIKQNFSLNLTQSLVFALFLLLLFCFVIFLSLPVVFKTSCDFRSMSFHFTIESLPQNDVCIK